MGRKRGPGRPKLSNAEKAERKLARERAGKRQAKPRVGSRRQKIVTPDYPAVLLDMQERIIALEVDMKTPKKVELGGFYTANIAPLKTAIQGLAEAMTKLTTSAADTDARLTQLISNLTSYFGQAPVPVSVPVEDAQETPVDVIPEAVNA